MTKTLEILDRLVGFPTLSSESNLAIIDYIQDFLGTRGFTVTQIGDSTGQKAGLFASLGETKQGGVMLSGHTDVVPVTGQNWASDPFKLRRDGPRVYGRGTTDMKGYLAAMMSLADRTKGRALATPLKLAFSFDEEVGCLGIPQMLPLLESTIGTPAMCFVGEPTEMQIATGHKGKAALRAICHGATGHSAQAPNYLNALHLAADFVAGIRGLQRELERHGTQDKAYDIPYSTLHIGKLFGGTALNIVPDHAQIIFEMRHLAQDATDGLRARIDRMAAEIATQYRATHPAAEIEIGQISAYPGLETAQDASISRFAADLLPKGTPYTKVAYGTEAGYFDQAGIPTVVCGPGNMNQGHKADEFIETDQLAQCDAMFDQLLDRLVAGDISV